MARIILIHGAWGNALNWVSVAPVLKAAGHTVEALDLPGHGANGAASGAIGPESSTARSTVVSHAAFATRSPSIFAETMQSVTR